MSNFNVKDAGYEVGVNVNIVQRDSKTGRIITQRQGHNRCLRMTLLGITKWLNGEFNPSQPYLISYDWIPRYLGVGTNVSSGGDAPTSVTSSVKINDTRLLNEISPRMKLPERNKIINKSSQSYIQLVISTYLPEEYYNDQTIAEAGLFSQATGNNCLFRITFDGIKKTRDSVVEVTWTISIISVDSQNEPFEEVNKEDLELSINNLVARFGELYEPFKKSCNDLINLGIFLYGKSDASQTEIDEATLQLNKDFNDLKNVDPPGIPDTVIEQVDEINGEVI